MSQRTWLFPLFLLSFLTALWLFIYVNRDHWSTIPEIKTTEVYAKEVSDDKSLISPEQEENLILWSAPSEERVESITFTGSISEEKKSISTISSPSDVKRLKVITLDPIKQKWNNTCVPYNLSLLLKWRFNQDLDISLLYKLMNKKSYEYWFSGLYGVDEEYGWFYITVKEGEYFQSKKTKEFSKVWKEWYESVQEARDWEKIKELWIWSEQSTSLSWMKSQLDDWNPVILEIPMTLINKYDKSGIYHAITVYKLENNTLYYINTLNGKYEQLDLSIVLHNEDYLLYPFTYLTSLDVSKYPNLFKFQK